MSKLILTHEVTGLGSAGDVVDVKNGYARNYLIPQGFAMAWTRGGEKQVEQIKAARVARELHTIEQAQDLKAKLEATKVKLTVKAGREGRLFGSVKTSRRRGRRQGRRHRRARQAQDRAPQPDQGRRRPRGDRASARRPLGRRSPSRWSLPSRHRTRKCSGGRRPAATPVYQATILHVCTQVARVGEQGSTPAFKELSTHRVGKVKRLVRGHMSAAKFFLVHRFPHRFCTRSHGVSRRFSPALSTGRVVTSGRRFLGWSDVEDGSRGRAGGVGGRPTSNRQLPRDERATASCGVPSCRGTQKSRRDRVDRPSGSRPTARAGREPRPPSAPLRTISWPSRAPSAACCSARMPWPTSSRSCAAPTSTFPKHEIIYDAILSLYSHGEPTDVITVTDELTKIGELSRAGGAEYLHTLTSLVPTAANAGYYANIVAEKALLRRLVEAGTRITQMGYKAEGEVARPRQQRTGRDLLGHRLRRDRGLRPAHRGGHRRHRRDRGGQAQRRLDDRRPHRLRRTRRADQRPASRPDDHRRRPPRARKVDPRARLRPRRRHQARHADHLLLPRDGSQRDRDAPAVRRVLRPPAEHAQGHGRQPRLDDHRIHPRPHQRRSALHRRQPEHDAGRDPRQVPAAQAARRA